LLRALAPPSNICGTKVTKHIEATSRHCSSNTANEVISTTGLGFAGVASAAFFANVTISLDVRPPL